jgi:uncharacterized protein (DUF305 family)
VKLVVLLSCLVLLAGCGGSGAASAPLPPPTVSPTNEFNPNDVMFLQMMIPHHKQGIELVRLAKTREIRGELKELAAAIEVTQLAEVDSMTGWLGDWRQPPTADVNPDAHAHHGGLHTTSDELIADVKAASGQDFERSFINVLLGHQHNAVELAKTETEGGINPQSKDLASRITQSRTAQIAQLLKLLG